MSPTLNASSALQRNSGRFFYQRLPYTHFIVDAFSSFSCCLFGLWCVCVLIWGIFPLYVCGTVLPQIGTLLHILVVSRSFWPLAHFFRAKFWLLNLRMQSKDVFAAQSQNNSGIFFFFKVCKGVCYKKKRSCVLPTWNQKGEAIFTDLWPLTKFIFLLHITTNIGVD